MTSPDRLPLGRYQQTQPQAVGDWNMNSGLGGLGDALIKIPMQLLAQALQGLFGGGSGSLADGPLSIINSVFSSKWGQLDATAETVDELVDGQLALNERTDLLSALEDFGAAYAPASMESTGVIPFTTQIGPMTGCHLASNGIVLDKPGLWKIDCRLAFSWISILTAEVQWDVRIVHLATGEEFSVRRDQFTSTQSTTRQVSFPVVVPTGGYLVQVRIWSIAATRGFKGGSRWNGLSVHHISHSTDHQIIESGETE